MDSPAVAAGYMDEKGCEVKFCSKKNFVARV
jgi:hypothetical protein